MTFIRSSMASSALNSLPSLLAIVLVFLCSDIALATKAETHLHFYIHDRFTGPNPSVVKVVSGSSPQGLGDMVVFDNLMTESPEPGSRQVGRAQGIIVEASREDVAWVLTSNLVFMNGKYNGSTLAVVGRKNIFSPVKELSVVGGTRAFRGARGYVVWKFHQRNSSTGDAIAETDVHFTC